MSEMIERGARALALRHGEEWGRIDPQMREGYREDVRAILDCLKTPTVEMRKAGLGRPGEGLIQHYVWEAMIDAALEP